MTRVPKPASLLPATSTNTTEPELKPGDRVEALGNFAKPMGTFGTVEEVEGNNVVVLWDSDDHMTLGRAWIKKARQ